ncbi:hypothetical protein PAQ31011_00834 [Pandoraea aquatica]|uniref:Uncharacterized protein n=1 Tax=Pandoraea aquatica TaxID=2508290 RepID=A0A5E4SN07_9BURK|nr:hypothetical protein [Pandoraea aquatica]VVD75259.1 hypothetical protein PAQ31011_00834 [Pandoraea aquatica]
MATWNVLVDRHPTSIYLGQVNEDTEELARCAALHKFGMSEDEYFDALNHGEEFPCGISPGDDFSVSRA